MTTKGLIDSGEAYGLGITRPFATTGGLSDLCGIVVSAQSRVRRPRRQNVRERARKCDILILFVPTGQCQKKGDDNRQIDPPVAHPPSDDGQSCKLVRVRG